MAIDFNCPHCATPYHLKDELAGKKATCKNTSCRQVITIPAPGPNGARGPVGKPPPPKPADVEAAAAAALADQPQEQAAADTPIPVVCAFCDHKWTEPRDKAGKNVLCPNPECRQRNKVPVPKDDKPKNWRDGPQGPSLARENFEKPADVIDAEAKVVSKDAWTKGGGADADLDPIPLKRKLLYAAVVLTPVLLIVGGVWWVWTGWTESKKDQYVEQALKEMEKDKGAADLPGAEGPLFLAVLHTAAGEYELNERENRAQALKKAFDHFTKARNGLNLAAQKDDAKKPGAARHALGGELALAQLLLGGSDEEVKAEVRYPWLPRSGNGPKQRFNEKVYDVHTELQRTLQVVLPADIDLRVALARRLTRELVKKGQVDIAKDIPVMLFAGPEQAEAKAVVALEVFRADKTHAFPKQAAEELKAALAKGPPEKSLYPASAVVLWKAVGTEKAPTFGTTKLPANPGETLSDSTRAVVVGLALLDGKADEAMEAARRPGQPAGQLRAAVLIAEWAPDPGAALDAALVHVTKAGKKGDGPPAVPPALLFRLSQLAAAAGKADQAKALADAIPDDGLKAWAKADAVRLGAPPTAALDEAAVELPDDAAKVRAGHGWGRYWVARHNMKVTGERKKVELMVKGWPTGTVSPLGLAGLALGIRDRER